MERISNSKTCIQKTFAVFLLFLLQKRTNQSFKIAEDKEIKDNQLLTILTNIPKEYELSFEFKPTAFISGFASILHLTVDGDMENYGDRTPSVFLSPGNTIHFSTCINDSMHYAFSSDIVYPLNEWIQIKISQLMLKNEYVLTFYISGTTVFKTKNSNPLSFSNVKVYLGSPWYSFQPGFIRNLSINNACAESFTLAENTEIKQNQLITNLTNLPKEYTLSFDYKPTAYLSIGTTTVIHLTIGGNGENIGDRTPGVWVLADNSFHFSSCINGDKDKYFSSGVVKPLNEWVTIKISQIKVKSSYIFSIEVASTIVYSTPNNFPMNFSNVMVYLGDPWYTAQLGFIKNLVIINTAAAGSMLCKPQVQFNINGQLTNKSLLSMNTTIRYVFQSGEIAYDVTWEYMLPYFSTIISKSESYFKKATLYTISGALNTTDVNQYLNIALDMTSCTSKHDFTLEIPLKTSFKNKAGYLWKEYKSFRTIIPSSYITSQLINRDSSALKESYGRGICWDEVESWIYVCMNLYVTNQKTACYVSNNYGQIWKKLDNRVGCVLGHHILTRELYVIHRNQKTYLMYHKTYKKWLAIANNDFEINISKNLNASACFQLDGNNEQLVTFQTHQWMGNGDGLFFRSSNYTWIQRIDWKYFI